MYNNKQDRNARGGAPRVPQEFDEKVIRISRVTKKTKGGNNMSFTALVVVGDRKGRVGVALGKAKDVMNAIKKGDTKTMRSTALGAEIARLAIEKKITKIVFDRGAYKYHGRVKAVADAARTAGLEF